MPKVVCISCRGARSGEKEHVCSARPSEGEILVDSSLVLGDPLLPAEVAGVGVSLPFMLGEEKGDYIILPGDAKGPLE